MYKDFRETNWSTEEKHLKKVDVFSRIFCAIKISICRLRATTVCINENWETTLKRLRVKIRQRAQPSLNDVMITTLEGHTCIEREVVPPDQWTSHGWKTNELSELSESISSVGSHRIGCSLHNCIWSYLRKQLRMSSYKMQNNPTMNLETTWKTSISKKIVAKS